MKRANAGGHKAMLHLGVHYFHGDRGLPQDKDEGLKWYHRAVEAGSGDGDGMGAYNIGTIYFTGDEQRNKLFAIKTYFVK